MKIDNNVLTAIKNSQNVAIYTHMRPDADAIGSACALKMALEKLGKNADVFCDTDEISPNYMFMKYVNKINNPQLKNYDTGIAVDCADNGRMGKYEEFYKQYPTTINIDHHITNNNFGMINCVVDASSTGEILFTIFKALRIRMEKNIATALYAAISSDTGCFMHSNTTADVHKIVGQLMRHDIDITKANYFLFKRRSLGQIKLQQIALNNLRFFLDNKMAIISLKANDFKECNIGTNDNFGLVDICINIEKIEVGVLISEIKPNLYACSIRGKGNVDVSVIASEFGGGGHTNAAGCNIFGTNNTVINKLIKATKKVL